MRLLALIAIVSGLLLPSGPAAALCIANHGRIDSTEAVTIQIADTFFEIPESAFYYKYQRVPMARESVRLSNLSLPDGETVYVSLGTEKATKPSPYEASVDDHVTVRLMEGANDDEILAKKVIPYLQSISSKTPPATWKRDQFFVRAFDLGAHPCVSFSFWNLIAALPEAIANAGGLDYNDILEGLLHRNANIREAAAKEVMSKGAYTGDIKKVLVKLAKNDKVDYVRHQAARTIEKMAETDRSLIPDIRDILLMEDDQSWYRSDAATALYRVDPGFFTFIEERIPRSDDGFKTAVGGVLGGVMQMEVRQKQVTKFDQFSPDAKRSAQDLMLILSHYPSETLRSEIMQSFGRCGSAAATPEVVAYLNRETLEDKSNLSYVAVSTLKDLGVSPERPDEIIERFSKGNKYDYQNIKKMLGRQ